MTDLQNFIDFINRRTAEVESEPDFIRIRASDGSEHEVSTGRSEYLNALKQAKERVVFQKRV